MRKFDKGQIEIGTLRQSSIDFLHMSLEISSDLKCYARMTMRIKERVQSVQQHVQGNL